MRKTGMTLFLVQGASNEIAVFGTLSSVKVLLTAGGEVRNTVYKMCTNGCEARMPTDRMRQEVEAHTVYKMCADPVVRKVVGGFWNTVYKMCTNGCEARMPTDHRRQEVEAHTVYKMCADPGVRKLVGGFRNTVYKMCTNGLEGSR